MLSSTLRSVLSAREMAGFLTALLQAALLLEGRLKMFSFFGTKPNMAQGYVS